MNLKIILGSAFAVTSAGIMAEKNLLLINPYTTLSAKLSRKTTVVYRNTFASAGECECVVGELDQKLGELEQIKIRSEGSLRTVMVNPYGPCAVTVSAKINVDKLVEALEALPYIEELNLNDCKLNSEDAKKISKWLSTNRSLRKLYLGSNLIADEGAIAISEALKVNRTLKILHLGGNEIHGTYVIQAAYYDYCLEDQLPLYPSE